MLEGKSLLPSETHSLLSQMRLTDWPCPAPMSLSCDFIANDLPGRMNHGTRVKGLRVKFSQCLGDLELPIRLECKQHGAF